MDPAPNRMGPAIEGRCAGTAHGLTAVRPRASESWRRRRAYAAKARAEAFGGTENLIRQALISALVKVVRDSKMPLVPSVMVGGDAANGVGGVPGLLLAMATKGLGAPAGGPTEQRRS